MPYKDKDKQNDWMVQNRKVFTISIMKNTESDILDWLEKQDNKGGAVKNLIRLQIEREKTR